MQMPIEKENYYYYNLIEDAVFNEDTPSTSPAYITAMTKAYFKDENPQHAIKFFEKSIGKVREQQGKRDDYLVSLYDSMSSSDSSCPSYD